VSEEAKGLLNKVTVAHLGLSPLQSVRSVRTPRLERDCCDFQSVQNASAGRIIGRFENSIIAVPGAGFGRFGRFKGGREGGHASPVFG
jgi:hypothetical protein